MIKDLRFWVQKVLPLVYDDSLSYYELLCKVVDKLNEIIKTINVSDDNVEEIVKETLNEWRENGTLGDLISPHVHSDYHYNLYVDCVNGDDSNSGESPSAPLYTLDKALDKLNSYGAGGYIYLIASGTYTISYPTIHCLSLHLIAQATNIRVVWGLDGNASTKKFYASYLHFGGFNDKTTVFYSNGSGEAGFEPGKIYAVNTIFDGEVGSRFAVYGGACQIVDSTLKVPFRVGGSNGIFDGCTLDPDISKIGTSYVRIIQIYNGSDVTITGGLTIKGKSEYGNLGSWISCNYSCMYLRNTFTYENDAENGIPIVSAEGSQFYGTWARINSVLNNNCSLSSCTYNGKYVGGNKALRHFNYFRHNTTTVPAHGTADFTVEFGFEFPDTPIVLTQIYSEVDSESMSNISAQVVSTTLTTTGVTIRLSNSSDTARTPNVLTLVMLQ